MNTSGIGGTGALAYYNQSCNDGLQSAKANANAHGARLVSCSETWSVDSSGNVTMMAQTTRSTLTSGDTGSKMQKTPAGKLQEGMRGKNEQDEKRTISASRMLDTGI